MSPSTSRIDEIEKVTKHDVIAFLTHLAEFIGPDAPFVHQGMTSSDVLDTCLSVQPARACRWPVVKIVKRLSQQYAGLAVQAPCTNRPMSPAP